MIHLFENVFKTEDKFGAHFMEKFEGEFKKAIPEMLKLTENRKNQTTRIQPQKHSTHRNRTKGSMESRLQRLQLSKTSLRQQIPLPRTKMILGIKAND